MSQMVEGPVKNFTSGSTIGQYLRVRFSAGTVLVAGADDPGIGTATNASLVSGDPVAIRLWTADGTRKMVANAAITSGNLVYAAASGKIGASGNVCVGRALEAASGDGSIIEVLPVSVDVGSARVLRARITTANVNAGATLLTAIPGLKYRIHDVSMISIGGNATSSTTIDILATQSSSSVKLVANAVAGLTQSTVLRAGATNSTVLADGASFVANDANTAITIGKTGSSLTVATNIDVLITYSLEV